MVGFAGAVIESQASKTQADKGEAGAEAIGVEPPQRKLPQSNRDTQSATDCTGRQRLQIE